MKNIYASFFVVLLTITSLQSQSILACYPLQSDAVDTTGNNGDIFLKNAPFQNNGVYSNGVYNGVDTTGSVIQTPSITNFNFENFTVLLEFYMEEYPDFSKPVMIGGSSWRWLGVYVNESGQLELMANDGTDFFTTQEVVTLNKWNLLAVSYDGTSKQLSLYYNRQLISQQIVPLLEHNNDSHFVNDHRGSGLTFKGYWKNLKIYNSSLVAGVYENNMLKDIEVLVHHHQLQILLPEKNANVHMHLINMAGATVKSSTLTGGLNQVNTSFLKPGIYLLTFRSRLGQQAVKRISIVR